MADLDLKAEPVGAKEATGGVESHGSGDLALIVVAGAGKSISVEFVGPGRPADEWFVKDGAQGRHAHGQTAQLHHLQKHGNFGQVGDDNSCLAALVFHLICNRETIPFELFARGAELLSLDSA